MHGRRLKLVALAGCLVLALGASTLCSFSFTNRSLSLETDGGKMRLPQLSESQLQKQAQAITVKVMSKAGLGSGFLLKKKGFVYTVVTNAHVLRADAPPYRIQTYDGQIWQNIETLRISQRDDLALLRFRSDRPYNVAMLGSQPGVTDGVFASGFPFTEDGIQTKGFTFTSGKVSLILPKPLKGGYQLGLTNDIQKGMSGGPLLNNRGEVVGVNGMHAYPLWDAPSVFESGEEADADLHKMIVTLSWAVPIARVLSGKFLDSGFGSNKTM